MEQIFTSLLSFQFALLCLAIGAIVFVVKTVVEYFLKTHCENSKVWKDLVLPILPVLLGAVSPFINPSYPETVVSLGDKFMMGLLAGFSSSLVVRLFKAFLKKKLA